jgi:hypothetical protein
MTSNRYLMVNAIQPAPGKEDAYNKWHNNHVTMIFDYQGMKRVNRHHFLKPLGPTGPASPPYMTMYECESKELFEGLFKGPQMQKAKVDYETNWPGLGEVIWAGNYEPVKTLERSVKLADKTKIYTEIVGSGPKPGNEKAYLDYYVGHFTKMFEYKGIQRISYGHMLPPMGKAEPKCPPYLTIYEFISQAAMEAFYTDPVFTSGGKEWEEVGQPCMDLQWCANYVTIKTLER